MPVDQTNPALNSHSHALVKALEGVILPIIDANVSRLAANKGTGGESREGVGPRLEEESKQLVHALERFISALVCRQSIQQNAEGMEGKKAVEISEQAVMVMAGPTSTLESATIISANQAISEQPSLLKRALEKAHHYVFNKLPIRLLAFKPDGSNVELIDRSMIVNHISTAIASNFDEAAILSRAQAFGGVGSSAQDDVEEEIIEGLISRHAKYAILSHTWLYDARGEVTYGAWRTGDFNKDSAGYQKLANFCTVAAVNHGATFCWMDTICINKESSSELDESIRSMYNWYRDASVCVTYLAQTTSIQYMRNDSWFTRGWTLQELLAPNDIEFYGADWKKLASGLSNNERNRLIQTEIHAATSITQQDIETFNRRRSSIPISKRMKWAANRRVTREEDVAYSLMGIFDVSLATAYGEGSERAFMRLVKEILSLPHEHTLDILNWGWGPASNEFGASSATSVIPSGPKQYLWRSRTYIHWPTPNSPITLTHLGLQISVLLMPGISITASNEPCVPIGQFYATASAHILGQVDERNPRLTIPTIYNLLDEGAIGRSGWNSTNTQFRTLFGVLNFVEITDSVHLPHGSTSFALCFFSAAGSGDPQTTSERLVKISTSSPVLVDIKHHSGYVRPRSWTVKKGDLAQHGMLLRSMYL